jgi:hypothetical protein
MKNSRAAPVHAVAGAAAGYSCRHLNALRAVSPSEDSRIIAHDLLPVRVELQLPPQRLVY